MKSTQVGDPRVKNETIKRFMRGSVFQQFQASAAFLLSATAFISLQNVAPLPPRSVMRVTSGFLSFHLQQQHDTDGFIQAVLMPINISETPKSNADVYDRCLLHMAKMYVIGTASGFSIEPIEMTLQELDREISNMSSTFGAQAFSVWAQATADVGANVSIYTRLMIELTQIQRNRADEYSRKGQKITEGWEGYEWHEAAQDLFNQQ